MKTYKSLFTLLMFLICSSAALAQFNIGPMLVYGSDSDLGLGVKAKFPATDVIEISPSFAFLSSTEILGIKASSSELNIDGHYLFNPGGATQIYGLAGLNMVFAKISGAGIDNDSSSEIGLNLGAGAEFGITDSLQGFGQLKYTLSEADQLGIHAGIYFNLGGN